MTGHRITETNLFKLLQTREAQDGFEGAEISSAVNNIVKEAWPILQQVSRAFPLYTLHDPEHSYRVAQNMARLIPESTLRRLNSIELSVLLYSAYFHDIGMAASQEEFYRWLDSGEYRAFVASHENWAYALRKLQSEELDEFDPREHYLRKHQARIDPDTPHLHDRSALSFRKLQDVVYTDFLRQSHAARGADLVVTRFGPNGQSDNKITVNEVNYAEQVALVCKSHWEDAMTLKAERYRRDQYLCSLPVNLQYCAVILRLADLLELDPERTPKVLLDFILLDLKSENSGKDPATLAQSKSAEEWAKHRSVLGYKVTPDEIRIEAKCSHPAIQRGLREWCDIIDAERRDCRLVVQENNGEITEKYQLKLENDVRKDYVESDGSYIYTDFQFQLDYDRIVNLVMGTELWGDPAIVFRELLQNAVDACHHRQALSNRSGVPYYPKILFRVVTSAGENDSELILSCEDNGTGMNRHIIENFLMRIGRSYYNSQEFRRQNLDFAPISNFGLGLMSYFMLTNKVKIETAHVGESSDLNEALSVEINSAGRYVILRPLKTNRDGTAVKLLLNSVPEMDKRWDRRDSPSWGPSPLLNMTESVLRSLAVHLEIPIDIYLNQDQRATIAPATYSAPPIGWDGLPALKDRCQEFVFEHAHEETGGLAGTFRFLLPRFDSGHLCFGRRVEPCFKMVIDNDGDLVFTTAGHNDPADHGIIDDEEWHERDGGDWDSSEARGVYRFKYGQAPPASPNPYDGGTFEIIKASLKWSQDGLIVGPIFPEKLEKESEREDGNEEKQKLADLFSMVPVPGLNAADIDLRGPWRIPLNVQRTDFDAGASREAFKERYFRLAAEMWKRILDQAGIQAADYRREPFISSLLRLSSWQLRAQLTKILILDGKFGDDEFFMRRHGRRHNFHDEPD
jgi:Histidine kinase-, DNA gyrase B-, and HSP90-like ATPase